MESSRAKKASDILARFFDEKLQSEMSQFQSFRSSWKQLVGERMADHSKPLSVVRHTLVIAADHSGWIQLLQMQQERILERIAKAYPELKITSLAFTILNESEIKTEAGDQTRAESPTQARTASPDGATAEAPAETQARDQADLPASPEKRAPSGAAAEEKPLQVPLPPPLQEIFRRMRSDQGN